MMRTHPTGQPTGNKPSPCPYSLLNSWQKVIKVKPLRHINLENVAKDLVGLHVFSSSQKNDKSTLSDVP